MSSEFATKMLTLTSQRRKLLSDEEAFFKNIRIALDVEKYFDLNYLGYDSIRTQAVISLNDYLKQLEVERNFYSEFNSSFVKEVTELAHDISSDEREVVLNRAIPPLQENDSIRMKINSEKVMMVEKLLKIIDVFDDDSEVDQLSYEINNHLDTQNALVKLQQKRGVDGQRFFERLINLFKS